MSSAHLAPIRTIDPERYFTDPAAKAEVDQVLAKCGIDKNIVTRVQVFADGSALVHHWMTDVPWEEDVTAVEP